MRATISDGKEKSNTMRNKIIAERLKELRKKKGCTQQEVAEAIGVSTSTYGMYEAGERMPSDKVKIKISAYFKKSVQSIFFAIDATNSNVE